MSLIWAIQEQADYDALPEGTHVLTTDGGILKKLVLCRCREHAPDPDHIAGRWWSVNQGTSQWLPAAVLFTPADLEQAPSQEGSDG